MGLLVKGVIHELVNRVQHRLEFVYKHESYILDLGLLHSRLVQIQIVEVISQSFFQLFWLCVFTISIREKSIVTMP